MNRKTQLTVQRKAIYEIVSEASDHPTAADIIDRLKTRGCSYAYATIYNSLRYLTDEGLIREVKLAGEASRYDARMEDHYHIVCTDCGRVDEVLVDAPSEWLEQITQSTGYEITEKQFILKGRCAQCSASKPTIQ